MNTIDFSFLGGFPFDEDAIDYLQQAYLDGFKALFANAGNTPIIISGMGPGAFANPNRHFNAGFFYLNGEIFYFPGGMVDVVSVPPPGSDIVITISRLPTSAVFESGAVHDVFIASSTGITIAPPSASAILFSTFKPWHTVAGEIARNTTAPFGAVSNAHVAPGDLGFTLNYRKNEATNTLHVWGQVNSQDAQNIPDPAVITDLATLLPADCRPASAPAFFPACMRPFAGIFRDAAGYTQITTITVMILTTGEVQAVFIRPEAGITGYTAFFNTIIPLD